MNSPSDPASSQDVRNARVWFPATENVAYFNTAAVGLASRAARRRLPRLRRRVGGDAASTTSAARLRPRARGPSVAALIGADRVRRRLDRVGVGGRRAGRRAVRPGAPRAERRDRRARVQLEPLPVAAAGDTRATRSGRSRSATAGSSPTTSRAASTAAPCWSRSAACRPRPGIGPTSAAISAIARAVGAHRVRRRLAARRRAAGADDLGAHRRAWRPPITSSCMHAGRGLGYCYLSREMQDRFVPVNAGWKAGRVPFESFFGPEMDLSPTASRFDNSISWLAAIGNEAALSVFDRFGADADLRAGTASWPDCSGRRSPRSAGRRSTCPRPTAARSCRSRSATPTPARLLAELKRRGVVGRGPRRQPASRGPLLQPRGRHRSGRASALADL